MNRVVYLDIDDRYWIDDLVYAPSPASYSSASVTPEGSNLLWVCDEAENFFLTFDVSYFRKRVETSKISSFDF